MISPSHPERDRFVKRARYALAGIRELWLVDPEERSLQILVLDGDELRSIGYSDGDATPPSPTFPDLELCPTALFRELDP